MIYNVSRILNRIPSPMISRISTYSIQRLGVTLFPLFMSSFIGGCSFYKESFDCPVGNGMACSSLHKVNKTMDRGGIDIEDSVVTHQQNKPHQKNLGQDNSGQQDPRVVFGSTFQVRR